MSAIGKGDWVQCIKTTRNNAVGLRVGGTYCVEAVREFDVDCCGCAGMGDVCNRMGLKLVDLRHHVPGSKADWTCSNAFRPLGGSALTRERSAPQVHVNMGPYFKAPVPAGFEPWD